MSDLPEERIDIVQFGTVGRQVVQVSILGPEFGHGSFDEGITVKRANVQHHDPQYEQPWLGVIVLGSYTEPYPILGQVLKFTERLHAKESRAIVRNRCGFPDGCAFGGTR